jgi:hypothetical protein
MKITFGGESSVGVFCAMYFIQRSIIGVNSLSKYGTIVFGEVGGAGLRGWRMSMIRRNQGNHANQENHGLDDSNKRRS